MHFFFILWKASHALDAYIIYTTPEFWFIYFHEPTNGAKCHSTFPLEISFQESAISDDI
jgi:hypothetical protein